MVIKLVARVIKVSREWFNDRWYITYNFRRSSSVSDVVPINLSIFCIIDTFSPRSLINGIIARAPESNSSLYKPNKSYVVSMFNQDYNTNNNQVVKTYVGSENVAISFLNAGLSDFVWCERLYPVNSFKKKIEVCLAVKKFVCISNALIYGCTKLVS